MDRELNTVKVNFVESIQVVMKQILNLPVGWETTKESYVFFPANTSTPVESTHTHTHRARSERERVLTGKARGNIKLLLQEVQEFLSSILLNQSQEESWLFLPFLCFPAANRHLQLTSHKELELRQVHGFAVL